MGSLDFGDEAIEVLDEWVDRGRDWSVTVGFAEDVEDSFKLSQELFKSLKLVRRDDSLIFFFNLKLLQKLSRGERRVLIGHEVSHLAPECQRLWERIYRELCADEVSLKLVPLEDVSAMLSKSIRMFPYYPARQEFVLRLALIQEMRPVNSEGEPTVARSAGASAKDDWMDCA